MENKHITALITDYLDGTLDAGRQSEVAAHMQSCESCATEVEAMRALLLAFKNERQAAPSEDMRKRFNKMLEAEKQNGLPPINIVPKRHWLNGFLKIAAGIALLAGAFTLGKFQQKQQSNTTIAAIENKSEAIKETAMLSLMENQSASKRIKGVNFIEEFSDPDETIIAALADRMLLDRNTNVRLTAVEALGKFTASETVKNAFITALGTEKDPSIQIVIIHTLAAIQEQKAVAPMKKLLEQEDTQAFVKKEIQLLLPTII